MEPYDEGDQLPDGRSAIGDDPVKPMRPFMGQVQTHWQDIYNAGSIVMVDETMVGWTAESNVHITRLQSKPTERGVCLKTAADGLSKVMLSFELLECAADQARKRYREEGKAAAVTLRLREHLYNKGPCLVLADAWFGGTLTSSVLMQRGLHSIVNVKTQTKYFCKKDLWESARDGRRHYERDDRAYRQCSLPVNNKSTTFTAAFHMDKALMTLLGTAGSSSEAPEVMRSRIYRSAEGDLVHWTGILKQPNKHYIYRSYFNAVDIHNKLAIAPGSLCRIGARHLMLKLWLAVVAMHETNAHLTYCPSKRLASDKYCHGEFKIDLIDGLLKLANKLRVNSGNEENQGPVTRNTSTAMMPPVFLGHASSRDASVNRKCMHFGKFTKVVCGCGRAICGTQGGKTCWAWHLAAVRKMSLMTNQCSGDSIGDPAANHFRCD
jgi:hypothetical protein